MQDARAYERTRLVFDPTWEQFRGLAITWANNHRWRFDRTVERDDLVGEFGLCFVRVCQTYPLVTEPANFVALWKTACFNQVMSLASRRLRLREAIGDPGGLSAVLEDRSPPVDYRVQFELVQAEAPVAVRAMVQAGITGTSPRGLRKAVRRATGLDVIHPEAFLSGWLCGVWSDGLTTDTPEETTMPRKTKTATKRNRPKKQTHEIEVEIVKLTELTRKEADDDDRWLQRLARAAGKMPDEDFANMSDDAIRWVNVGVDEINDHRTPLDFEEFLGAKPKPKRARPVEDVEEEEVEEPEEEEEEEEGEEPAKDGEFDFEGDDFQEEEEEPEPEKPARRGKRAKKSERKKDKEDPAKGNALQAFRTLVFLNPSASRSEILALCEEEGIEVASTTSAKSYSEQHALLRLVDELGLRLVPARSPDE